MESPSVESLLEYLDAAPETRSRHEAHAHVTRNGPCRLRFEGLQRIGETERELRRREQSETRGESSWHPVRVAPPITLGSLRLHKLLNRDTYSITFEGHDQVLKQTVAATFLVHPNADVLAHLRTTARLADLSNGAINRLHYVDVVESYPLIVSDLCPGLSLDEVDLAQAPPQGRAALILVVGRLLQELHQAGLQHGNLQRSGIRVDAGGHVRLAEACLPPFPDAQPDATALRALARDLCGDPVPHADALGAWLEAWTQQHALEAPSSNAVPMLRETISMTRPAARPIPRAEKVRDGDVPGLVPLMMRRHGWGKRLDPSRNPDWLDQVFPELKHFSDTGRAAAVEEILEDDQTAETAAGVAAILGPLLVLPLMNLLRPWLSTPLWFAVAIFALGLSVWLFAGATRMGYGLLTQKTMRIKLRRRLLAEGTPICVRCGYDLQGNRGGVCPECGYLAPLIQFRVQVRGQDESGPYNLTAFMNSLTPATAGSLAYAALREEGYQVHDILNVRQEPGWDADWPVGLLRVEEKEYLSCSDDRSQEAGRRPNEA